MAKKHQFNLELDPPMREALEACHKASGLARALVLRYSLTFYHAMTIGKVPTCANGQACLCPHMHVQNHQQSPVAAGPALPLAAPQWPSRPVPMAAAPTDLEPE